MNSGELRHAQPAAQCTLFLLPSLVRQSSAPPTRSLLRTRGFLRGDLDGPESHDDMQFVSRGREALVAGRPFYSSSEGNVDRAVALIAKSAIVE